MRFLQHKQEAYWFYRFLSIVYDRYVNPWFWTPEMRSEALKLARLDRPDLRVAEIGAGTGFTTQGLIEFVAPAQIDALDQSPHQQARARRKPGVRDVNFFLGDAEQLPFPTDHHDRYVSAGSIEYWPEPQRAIAEAYRVLKPGGVALIIGPLRPQNRLARFLADLFMLFPEEHEYEEWYRAAGFSELRKVYIRPKWLNSEKYGIAIAGVKPAAGASPWRPAASAPRERLATAPGLRGRLIFAVRFLVGAFAGFLFVPLAMLKSLQMRFLARPARATV
jgi:MPBQ/MSBQ methyltransferase